MNHCSKEEQEANSLEECLRDVEGVDFVRLGHDRVLRRLLLLGHFARRTRVERERERTSERERAEALSFCFCCIDVDGRRLRDGSLWESAEGVGAVQRIKQGQEPELCFKVFIWLDEQCAAAAPPSAEVCRADERSGQQYTTGPASTGNVPISGRGSPRRTRTGSESGYMA